MTTAGASDLREQLGDTFTYGEAKEAGVGDRRLYTLRDSGKILALGGGVYRWADAPPADSDLIEIAERVPHATLCLETALLAFRPQRRPAGAQPRPGRRH